MNIFKYRKLLNGLIMGVWMHAGCVMGIQYDITVDDANNTITLNEDGTQTIYDQDAFDRLTTRTDFRSMHEEISFTYKCLNDKNFHGYNESNTLVDWSTSGWYIFKLSEFDMAIDLEDWSILLIYPHPGTAIHLAVDAPNVQNICICNNELADVSHITASNAYFQVFSPSSTAGTEPTPAPAPTVAVHTVPSSKVPSQTAGITFPTFYFTEAQPPYDIYNLARIGGKMLADFRRSRNFLPIPLIFHYRNGGDDSRYSGDCFNIRIVTYSLAPLPNCPPQIPALLEEGGFDHIEYMVIICRVREGETICNYFTHLWCMDRMIENREITTFSGIWNSSNIQVINNELGIEKLTPQIQSFHDSSYLSPGNAKFQIIKFPAEGWFVSTYDPLNPASNHGKNALCNERKQAIVIKWFFVREGMEVPENPWLDHILKNWNKLEVKKEIRPWFQPQ